MDASVVGQGAYGEVRRAWDNARQRPVAIKKISGAFSNMEDTRRIFREVHILSQLRNSTGIVRLLDVVVSSCFRDFKDIRLVFELLPTDLDKVIRSGQVTAEHAMYFMHQLLQGLEFLSRCGIVHRDIKPANLLVDADCNLKICDLGLARTIGHAIQCRYFGRSQSGDGSVTQHVATRWYRAPEVILLQPYDEKIDIWAAGCVMAEMFTGTPLFPGSGCYPMTPQCNDKQTVSADQMHIIVRVLGMPSEHDLRQLSPQRRQYMDVVGGRYQNNLHKRLCLPADSPAVILMNRMLEFSPGGRISASEALEHFYFKGHYNVPVAEETVSVEVPDTSGFTEEEFVKELFLDSHIIRYHLSDQ